MTPKRGKLFASSGKIELVLQKEVNARNMSKVAEVAYRKKKNTWLGNSSEESHVSNCILF